MVAKLQQRLFWSWQQCRWGRWCLRRSWTRPSAWRGHHWRRRWRPARWSGSPPRVAACKGPSKTWRGLCIRRNPWHSEPVINLKLEQGWMIQCPISFCLTLSFISAFFDPNNFIANLLSVGAKMFCSWFLTQFGFDSLETEFLGRIGQTQVPVLL